MTFEDTTPLGDVIAGSAQYSGAIKSILLTVGDDTVSIPIGDWASPDINHIDLGNGNGSDEDILDFATNLAQSAIYSNFAIGMFDQHGTPNLRASTLPTQTAEMTAIKGGLIRPTGRSGRNSEYAPGASSVLISVW